MKSNKFLLAFAGSFLFGTAAFAADVPIKGPVYTKAPAAFSWNGVYAGVHGGYAWADNDIATFGAAATFTPSSGIFGVQFGYNRHIAPNWVLGYEVDFSWVDLSATGPVPGFLGGAVDTNFFGTARTRLGYASGPWLIYGTAGVAWATSTFALNPAIMNFDRAQIGYAVGAGVEYALNRNWSAKIEYLFADLDGGNSTLAANAANSDLTLSTVRVGLNYRFADASVPAAAFPVKAPVRVDGWSGSYIGVHVGYGTGSFDSVRGAASTSLDPDGGIAGFQAGYNWRISPNMIAGIESDTSWGSLKANDALSSIDVDAMGTVRARLGVTSDRWMLYATGGLAWAHADSVAAPGLVSIYDRYYLGWTGGVGIEYAFAPRWTAKLEYLYTDFGTRSDFFAATSFDDSLTASTVRVGINYRSSLLELLTGR